MIEEPHGHECTVHVSLVNHARPGLCVRVDEKKHSLRGDRICGLLSRLGWRVPDVAIQAAGHLRAPQPRHDPGRE